MSHRREARARAEEAQAAEAQQRATLADDELAHGVHALALKLQLAEERAESDELMCADACHARTHDPCRVRSLALAHGANQVTRLGAGEWRLQVALRDAWQAGVAAAWA